MKRQKKLEKDAPPIGDRLPTLREAADVLRLSTRTMRQYLQRGDIEGRIIGGRWRFRRADLDAFFANGPRNWDFAGKGIAAHATLAVARKLGSGESSREWGHYFPAQDWINPGQCVPH